MRDPVSPSLRISEPEILINVTNSDALVEDQGYTYNQVGFTYNQVGIFYGGIYNQNEDVIPLVLTAINVIPNIFGVDDPYTPPAPPVVNKVGPGWFMFINL